MKFHTAETDIRSLAIKALSSFFFVGYIPFASGTFGSLAAFLLYFFVIPDDIYVLSGVSIFLIIIAIYLSSKAEILFNKKDPSEVVIDEVAGYFIAVLFLPKSLINGAIAFVFFRIFDIFKPYPANLIDEKMGGGCGVVFDDVIAGIYANAAAQILTRLL